MQTDEYIADVFAANRFLLRCAGLWPPNSQSKLVKICYKMYTIAVVLYVNLFYTSTEFLSLFYTYKIRDDFTKNINFFLTHLMGAVKVTFWFFRGHVLKKLMVTLESKHFHYASCKFYSFYPSEIWKRYERIGFNFTFGFVILAHLTLLTAYVPRLTTAILNPPENGDLFYQTLPYFSWMPFNHSTPTTYVLTLLFQMGPVFCYAYSIIGMDSLFMNLMNFIAAHFVILQGAFMSCRSMVAENNKEMKKIYRHLQTVLRTCEEVENIYRFVTLGQAMATLFIFCTSLFTISTTPISSKQFYAEIFNMMCVGLQLVMYCWFGNEVTLSASNIPFHIWNSDWFDCEQSIKKSLIITMIRMQKPLHMTVGKFAPLTLQTLVWVLKTSYSFFAVIKKAE